MDIVKERATLSLVRDINYELVWRHLSSHEKATIPNIARKIGLSLPTVTRAIEFGLEIGMVVPAEMAESARGRKAQLYMLNPEYAYFLLILIDNNSLHFEVRNLTGGVVESDVMPIDYDEVLAGIDSVFLRYVKKYPNIQVSALAVTGVVHNGKVLDSWTIPTLNNFDLKEYLGSKTDIIVNVENNLKALTLSSKSYVKNNEEKMIVSFEFGHTGYGAGVSVNGEILQGRNGSVGEFGSLPLDVDRSDRTDLFSKSLQSIIAILNPDAVIIYTSGGETDVETVIANVKQEIPAYALPDIIKGKDFVTDCLDGLNILCLRSLNETLRMSVAV